MTRAGVWPRPWRCRPAARAWDRAPRRSPRRSWRPASPKAASGWIIMKKLDTVLMPGGGADGLKAGPHGLGGGVQGPGHHAVAVPRLHQHRAEPERVVHRLEGLGLGDALGLAALVVGPGQLLQQRSSRRDPPARRPSATGPGPAPRPVMSAGSPRMVSRQRPWSSSSWAAWSVRSSRPSGSTMWRCSSLARARKRSIQRV